MHKAFDLVRAGGVEEDLRAEHVGADERTRIVNAAIDVALGREVDDRMHALADSGRPAGEVLEEVRRGYRWKQAVFRYAQVRVSK